MYVKIPFEIVNGNVELETDLKKSVDRFIDLLVATPLRQFKADSDFGLVFKNFRFQNFDEKKRTVAYLNEDEPMNDYKITGTSKNPRNFAHLLKQNIDEYEPRMIVIEVSMDYNAKKHHVKLNILGQLMDGKPQEYSHEISFYVC